MKLTIAVLSLALGGCAASKISVVRSDAQAGTFTVIPAGDSAKEVTFAGAAEKTLISLGVKTVERPSFKFLAPVSAKDEVVNLHTSSSDDPSRTGRPPQIIDIVSMYDATKADYIAVTYAELPGVYRRIRIIKRADKSLVGSIDYPYDHNEELGSENPSPLHSALLASGLLKGAGTLVNCDPVGAKR